MLVFCSIIFLDTYKIFLGSSAMRYAPASFSQYASKHAHSFFGAMRIWLATLFSIWKLLHSSYASLARCFLACATTLNDADTFILTLMASRFSLQTLRQDEEFICFESHYIWAYFTSDSCFNAQGHISAVWMLLDYSSFPSEAIDIFAAPSLLAMIYDDFHIDWWRDKL